MKPNLETEERQFCELYVRGGAPYAGNAWECYRTIYNPSGDDRFSHNRAQKLLTKPAVREYIKQLDEEMGVEIATDGVKRFLTENLKKIVGEASTATYYDRYGNLTSPAAMRSVAVSASKALMEMYSVRVPRSDEAGGNKEKDNKGITLNVIAPNATDSKEDK